MFSWRQAPGLAHNVPPFAVTIDPKIRFRNRFAAPKAWVKHLMDKCSRGEFESRAKKGLACSGAIGLTDTRILD
jgi:hypothetical protein